MGGISSRPFALHPVFGSRAHLGQLLFAQQKECFPKCGLPNVPLPPTHAAVPFAAALAERPSCSAVALFNCRSHQIVPF
jgi:hypothetical protein